jgi:hypothetical protein
MSDPTPDPAPVKSGWWTSEHVLALVALFLTAAYASGLIPTDGTWAKIGAIVATVLTALGYTVSRTMIKTAAMLLLFVMVAHGSMACSGSQKAAETSLWSCTETAAVKDLEGTALNILTSGVSNWKQQLLALASAFGNAELDCAVSFARAVLASKVGGPNEAIARANEFLAERGVK